MSSYFTSHNPIAEDPSTCRFPSFTQDEELELMEQAKYYYKELPNKPSRHSFESREVTLIYFSYIICI